MKNTFWILLVSGICGSLSSCDESGPLANSMRAKLPVVLALSNILMLVACNDSSDPTAIFSNDEQGTTIGILEMLMAGDSEPYGFLSVSSHYNPIDETITAYSINGAISTQLKYQGRADGGTMTVAGIAVESDPTNSFVYHDILYPESGQTMPSFGRISTFALAGNLQNGVPSFSTTMYVPPEMKILSPELSVYNSVLSKSQGMTLTWNADPNNNLGVAIALMYMSEDPNVDDTVLWHTIEDDDGSYDLTAADLTEFSVGQDLMILLGRMNFKIHTEDGKDYTLYAIAQCMSGAELIN